MMDATSEDSEAASQQAQQQQEQQPQQQETGGDASAGGSGSSDNSNPMQSLLSASSKLLQNAAAAAVSTTNKYKKTDQFSDQDAADLEGGGGAAAAAGSASSGAKSGGRKGLGESVSDFAVDFGNKLGLSDIPEDHPSRVFMKSVQEKSSVILTKAGSKAKELSHVTVKHSKTIGEKVSVGAKQLSKVTVHHSRELGKVVSDQSRELGIATHAATLTAIEATKQSLQSIGSTPVKEDHETGQSVVKGEETDQIITRFPRSWVELLSAAGLLSGIVSFMVDSHIVVIASVILIVTAPYVVYQKRQLRNLGTMRQQQNKLRHLTNQFQTENNTLSNSVTTLSKQVEGLQQVEKDLDHVAKKSGTQVHKLVEIVHENDKLQQQIKDALNAQVMQQAITAILRSDTDGDNMINAKEVEILVIRLNAMPGIQIDLQKFQNFLKSDYNDMSMEDLCALARNLTDDSIPEKDRIVKLVPSQILMT